MLSYDLPVIITTDLFNLDCPADIAIDYLSDIFEQIGLLVTETAIRGLLIIINLKISNDTMAIVTINRLERTFSVEAGTQSTISSMALFLPITGTWCDICGYLVKLRQSVSAT